MSELKIFKDMEANCANCPFDITEGDIKRCYDDCGDKPNECYECSYLEYYLKSEADAVIAEKDKEIAELKKSLEQKKIAEGSVCRILWNLVDSGIIKEWHFNGEYNVLLNADDPHIQISELKTKIDKVSLKFCKQLCHNKYKRCLAMAMWCRESLRLMRTYEVTENFWNLEPGQDAEYFCKKGDFYSKWRKRWLKLAEKFKEAK